MSHFTVLPAADINWKHLLIKSVLPSVGWIWCVRDAKTVVNTRHSRTSAFLCFFTDTRIIFRTRGADRLHSSSGPRIVASCSLSLSSGRNGEQGVKTRNLWLCCCSAADTHLLSLATRQPATTFHLLTPFSLLTSPSRNHIWSCLGKITVSILSQFWAAVGTPSSLGGRAATARCGRWVGAAELDLGEGKAHPLYNPPNLLRLCLTVTPKRLERGTPNNSKPAGDCSGHCD